MGNRVPTVLTFNQEVSAGPRTLQNFDFLAQTLTLMLEQENVDRILLCNLLITLAQHEQFKPTLRELPPHPNIT